MFQNYMRRLFWLILGVAVSSIGIAMMLQANVGLEPWSVLQQGMSLRTGMTYGNAVIGLLDSRGVCIWSWHIWSVDYEIEATAQTYASGAVFMDRNLGALATDCTQAAAKGLYYQWGRKDPFPYPALAGRLHAGSDRLCSGVRVC